MKAVIETMQVTHGRQAFEIESAATPYHWSLRQWQLSLEDDVCLGLRIDEDWVAVSAFSIVMDEATLLNIAVLPACQGSGLARQLLIKGLESMSACGARYCFLEVRESNRRAQSLYRSQGFVDIGTRRGYYPTRNGREDARVMMCTLKQTDAKA